MSQERLLELQQTIMGLERKMRPLEWDLSRNQINEYRKQQLEKLRQEHGSLKQEIETLQ